MRPKLWIRPLHRLCCLLTTAYEPFNVDVAHLLAAEEGVVLQDHLVRVPDDHSQFPVGRLPENIQN
jgi:hypothetical protein